MTQGAAPSVTTTGATLAGVFLDCAARLPQQEAFRAPDGEAWLSLTWSQTEQKARELAAGLITLAVAPEDRVAIASTTRLDWVLIDLGIALAGAATTTIYPNTQTGDVTYILADSSSVIAVVEDLAQLDKVRQGRPETPALRTAVLIDGAVPAGDTDWVITLAELADRGRAHLAEHPTAVEDALAGVTSEHLSTLIYTSGTTGRPKGVELTHQNWVYLGDAIEGTQIVRSDQLHFLWLPLSHVFGKLLLAAQYRIGFATAIDGRIDKIVDNLAVIQPSFMAAAPRIFEKVHARVTSMAAAEGGVKAAIFNWAFSVGIACVRREQAGQSVPPHLSVQRVVADALVFTKIRARLGGRIETLVSGSAALNPTIAEWFAAAGLPILEGYGMTESSGASLVNRPGKVRIGSVGKPLGGTEVKIADDGEILLRGPAIMRGYHHLTDTTAEVLLEEGWLATGDVGELDADGYLKITDRKKDLVKTSGGKYIAPSAIEGAIKAANPLIGQVVVIADGRNFPSALVALDADSAAAWGTAHSVPTDQVPGDPRVRESVQTAIDEVNATLNRWEQIKKFHLLPRELDVDSGELTPSLKIKRAVVTRSYAEDIEAMYR